jgi:hypothetical protein
MTQKKVRILLAEDDSAETVDILASLFPDSTGGLDLTVVSTMATLIPTVRMVDPELILLDLELSLSIPLDAVHLVHRSAPGIPLVVLADPATRHDRHGDPSICAPASERGRRKTEGISATSRM